MKHFRLLLATGIVTIILTTSAFAGDMPMDISRQSPSQSQTRIMGDMPTGGAVASTPTVTEMALALMQSALLLF